MRAVKNTADGIAVVHVPEPDGPGVLVEPAAIGICGSDLHIASMGPSPVTIGHEIAGHLDGRAVAIQPFEFCGVCEQCESGRHQTCAVGNRRLQGVHVDGGMADLVLIDERCIVELPPAVGVADAFLVEPIAVALHAGNLAGLASGMRIAVVGAGSIGLLQGAVVRERGLEVDIVARHDAQRAVAERLGLHPGAVGRYDVVFDAAGTERSLVEAVDLVAPGGTVVAPAIYWDPVRLPGLALSLKEATLQPTAYWGCHEGRRETDLAAEMLARTPDLADALITHRFPLDRAPEAFATAADRGSGAIKVVIEPRA
ncbi:MAG: alcohol dehydrogenase catalytic domain-containing protein [Acidimicrobiia bacterium]|nr:alcohol dehydrogenase catalytic domain-containing protein [Acidimicrobiia bacterium]